MKVGDMVICPHRGMERLFLILRTFHEVPGDGMEICTLLDSDGVVTQRYTSVLRLMDETG